MKTNFTSFLGPSYLPPSTPFFSSPVQPKLLFLDTYFPVPHYVFLTPLQSGSFWEMLLRSPRISTWSTPGDTFLPASCVGPVSGSLLLPTLVLFLCLLLDLASLSLNTASCHAFSLTPLPLFQYRGHTSFSLLASPTVGLSHRPGLRDALRDHSVWVGPSTHLSLKLLPSLFNSYWELWSDLYLFISHWTVNVTKKEPNLFGSSL